MGGVCDGPRAETLQLMHAGTLLGQSGGDDSFSGGLVSWGAGPQVT